MNIRKNAASNVSKWKKKLETVEGEEERAKALAAVDKWESMKSAAEKELENRKKTDISEGDAGGRDQWATPENGAFLPPL